MAISAQFAEVLGDVVTKQKFQEHEFVEVANHTAAESANAAATPEVAAIEAAHRAAFRTGLGNSVFASLHSHVSNADVKKYASEVFTDKRIALVGSGLSLDAVKQYAETFFGGLQSAESPLQATKYFGGETRVETSSDKSHFVLAFEGAALDSAEYAALQVLRFALGGDKLVQYGAASGLLGQSAAKLGEGVELKAFNFGYSDGGLFGVYASGASSQVSGAVAAAAEQLKAAAKGLSEEEFKRAVAQAKFAATAGFETRLDRLETVGAQVWRRRMKDFAHRWIYIYLLQ